MDMDALTVEPGEPAESGSRTAWIAWQPPADGRFTWRILRAGFFSTVGEAPLQQSVFEGDTLDALELVAHDEGDETMDQVIAFDVRADATYRLALGLPRGAAEVPLGDQTFILEWGETPSNDDVANAMMVASSGGTYSGSNAFATTEKGEMTGTLGDSSLWWALEPDETGWMRFAAEGLDGLKLAVYRRGQDGTLQLVRSGRSLGSTASVSFLAEAGVRYLVRLGAYYWDQDGYGGDTLGDFELSWSPADPPAMLRYAGSVATGDLAEDGTVVELGELGAQAFNTDGTELYVVSRLGIVVFACDVPTGELTLRQTLPDYSVFDDDAPAMGRPGRRAAGGHVRCVVEVHAPARWKRSSRFRPTSLAAGIRSRGARYPPWISPAGSTATSIPSSWAATACHSRRTMCGPTDPTTTRSETRFRSTSA
ncbi:MAG: hypothetical protein OXL38_12390 [Gammaproteobacteria bacterium]|nr:hypothetical protein [Gammaproteobacteria bacterium]